MIAAQVAHAAADFCHNLDRTAAHWRETSNSVVVVTTRSLPEIWQLSARAREKGIVQVRVTEPDLANEVTALALSPGRDARRLCANLPLVGRGGDTSEFATGRERALRDLVGCMEAKDQTVGQSVFAHGAAVAARYSDLRDVLATGTSVFTWRLPSWLDLYRDRLVADLPADWLMDRYLTLHDCGKPLVRTVGGDGRVHFPEHARASQDVYRQLPAADDDVAELIGGDMRAHTLRACDVAEFAAHRFAAAWLLAAVAELHSNANMFGGCDSDGFKSKFKTLNRRGAQVCVARFGQVVT